MPRFDWTQRDPLGPFNRFPERAGDFPVRGWSAWRTLLDRILGAALNYRDDDDQALWDDLLQDFLEQAANDPRPPAAAVPCCVFVSHRKDDFVYAERIAWLAAQHGFQYWLDVHDPTLAAANSAKLPSPAQEVLIAAIIEMGLLNSTHIIAVHTKISHESKWIPYELGRVKQRRVFSSRSCGWFDPSGPQPIAGEYTFLSARTHSEAEVDRWFARQASSPRTKCRLSGPYWTRPDVPGALPKE